MGVGASAGGLEAFTQLLKHLPVDTGFGFVLVQHLDPQHESALAQLLTRATTMPVIEVTNNLRVKADHVYVIPPNTNLTIAHGVLKLHPRLPQRVAPRSIDNFFEALAKDQCERAVGVILSGSATDGTLGLEAIKMEGGLTFAQDDSARFDSMPRSAVAAGCVDFVLSPANIAKELAWIAKHPYVAGRAPAETPAATRGRVGAKIKGRGKRAAQPIVDVEAAGPPEQDAYKRIILLLRNHCGVDFSHYKSSTILRRMARRTLLNRRENLAHYADFLRGNAKELDALYADALINVTSFFRNEEAFTVLKQQVLARLLTQRSDEPVRAWVVGCSTGQEAYSIAMAFAEAAEKIPRPRKLQVFATDLNEANLEKARHGLYAKTIAQDLTPERLRRFFVEEEGGYRVIKALREQVVFARHNLISDPPFSRMDLICCRNLMIYLEPDMQKKALPAFHYALKPEGSLFLGGSESIGTFTQLFAPIEKKQKIFSKKAAPPQAFQLPLWQDRSNRPSPGSTPHPAVAKRGALDGFRGELTAEREADRVTVNQFAPPSVLIDADLRILQFRGPTGDYLEPPTGKASFDLLKMAREGLMLPLRATISRALKDHQTARREANPFKVNGTTRTVNIEVVPLKNIKERRYLVLFEDPKNPGHVRHADQSNGAAPPSNPVSKKDESSRIAALERDLAETRDYLQSVQESQEAANEELQAANEEGQSANEELQSLNEELETSKEELESTNEELTTVNEEMVSRNAELNRANSDLTNLQTSTKLVVVLLGRDLTIRRFSNQAEKQFHLHLSDLGRPIHGIRHNLDLPDLDAVILEVIKSVREYEREVQAKDGRWYSLRVRPYLTIDNKVDGAVLVLVDIDASKRSEQEVTHARDFAEAVITTVRDPLLILDGELRVHKVNEAFLSTFKISTAEVMDRTLFEIDQGRWNDPKLRSLLRGVIPRRTSFDNFEVTQNSKSIGRRTFLLNARMLSQEAGHREKILLGIEDVTVLLHAQARLRDSELRYRRLFETAKDGILILDPATRKITDANPFIVKLLGFSRKQLIKKELWQIGLLKDEAANREAFRELKRTGFIRYEDLPLKSKSGAHHEVEFVSNLYFEGGQAVIQCNIRDITERKQAEHALVASEARYRVLFESIDEGFCVIDLIYDRRGRCVDYRFVEANPAFKQQLGMDGALGKRIGEIAPDLEAYWFDAYGKVATTGRPVRFSNEAKPLKRWFDVYAFRVGQAGSHKVAVLFRDITARKQNELALITARTQLADHADQLESMVETRTAQLTATNRRLETSVTTIRKAQEEYRTLLLEAQAMQKRLRQLTHQIISAQEEERKKISRELHDDVVQTLVGINVELSALVHNNSGGVRTLKDKIAHTQRLVEKSVDSVHRFARELRPTVLDDLGLIPALHAFCNSLAERKKLKIKMTAFGGVEALESDKRTTLFRVAQEALTNIARHARATRVVLNITKVSGAIRMEIGDNGQSFAVAKVLQAKNPKRLGLVGMKERIEMVGGSLTIESTPGRGTTVRADIPFPPPASLEKTFIKK